MNDVSEQRLRPLYSCQCLTDIGLAAEPVFFWDSVTGDFEWLCAACMTRPRFMGYTPWPEPVKERPHIPGDEA